MKPKLKLKVKTGFLSSIFSGVGTTIRKSGLAAYVDLDYSKFAPLTVFNPVEEFVLSQNIDGSYSLIALSNIINNTQSRRVITAAGNVTVGVGDGLIILAKTVPENTDFLLPPDNTKIGPVKIVDFSGIGTSYTLRAIPNGSETISGQAAWQLSGAYSSIVLSPTGAGMGYAV